MAREGKEDEETTLLAPAAVPKEESGVTFMLLLSIFAAVVGSGITMGYNTSVLNNPQVYIKAFFDQSSEAQTGHPMSVSENENLFAFAVSSFCLAAPVGAILGPMAASAIGRKPALLLNNILMVIGALLSSFCVDANAYQMLIVGRIVTGINNGANTAICPMYLSEIAPSKIRGAVGVTFQLTVAIGVTMAEVLGFNNILGGKDEWPELFNVLLVLGFIQCAILPFCPESPRYLLIERGDGLASKDALRALRGPEANLDVEIAEMEEDDRKQKSEPPVGLKEMFSTSYIRRPLIVAVVMAMSQQLSGINAINVYSSPIFAAALGSDGDVVNYLVAITGVILIVVTSISVPLIDKVGRKKMHLLGLGGMATFALLLSIMLSNVPTDDTQVCHGVDVGPGNSAGNVIAMILTFLYVAAFSLGPGSVPWLIAPEMFTEGPRPKAVSIAVTANWLSNFAVQYLFPLIQEAACGWVFIIFAVLLTIFFVYLLIKLPDCDGLTTAEIVALFKDTEDVAASGQYNINPTGNEGYETTQSQ